MLNNGGLLIYLLFLHFIADFVLQSRTIGKRKSEHLGFLAIHVVIQFIVFLLGLHIAGYDREAILFFSINNMVIHGVIDWYLWRVYKWSVAKRKPRHLFAKSVGFKYWEDPMFYITIGFDQFLHISTIIVLVNALL